MSADNNIRSGRIKCPNGGSLSDESSDEELDNIKDSLKKIENIMLAEKKRRFESNKIMGEFIEDYVRNLKESITSKVDDDFGALK